MSEKNKSGSKRVARRLRSEIPDEHRKSDDTRLRWLWNQRMAVVEEHMAKAADLLAQEGADTIFEQNPGGHFQEPVERLTKGIRWILQD